VDSGEIVMDRMDRDHRHMVLDFLGKAIGQAREATHSHSHSN
jgi:hypothetical protein